MVSMTKGSPRFFLVFLFLSILIFTLSKFSFLDLPASYASKAATTFSSPLFFVSDFFVRFSENSEEKRLKEENLNLKKKLIDQQRLIDENKALHDQFVMLKPKSLDLLPAKVVGSPRFIPGIFAPEIFVIDKGSKDNIGLGNAVIFKDNLVGRITKISTFLSEATLVTNPNFKFTAKTAGGVLGVVKGEGNGEYFLDNVLLSDHLEKGELVETIGDLKIDQTGLPSGLIVGQIVSIESNSSSLLQRAKLKSLVDLSKISNVFILKGLR